MSVFQKPKLMSSTNLIFQWPKDIQSSVIEKQRNQNISIFEELEWENLDFLFFFLWIIQTDESII